MKVPDQFFFHVFESISNIVPSNWMWHRCGPIICGSFSIIFLCKAGVPWIFFNICSRLRARELGPLGPWVAMDLAVGLRQVPPERSQTWNLNKNPQHTNYVSFFFGKFFFAGKVGQRKLR